MPSGNERISVSLRNGVTQDYVRKTLRESEIVHFCGHADYVDDHPDRSGWRVADGKWTAADVRQMSESKGLLPLLVFANACQSGRTEDWVTREHSHLLGLAKSFLLAGVQHYIGTFWDVLDAPSEEFASRFYEALLAGQSIGMALRQARKDSASAQGDGSLIWASYVFYGDPTAQVFGVPDVQALPAPAVTPLPENTEHRESTREDKPQPRTAETEPSGPQVQYRQPEPRRKKRSSLFGAVCLVVAAAAIALAAAFWMKATPPSLPTPPSPSDRMGMLEYLSERAQDPGYQEKLSAQDEWTSRPLTLAVLPFDRREGESFNAGTVDALRTVLEKKFGEAPGFQILERKKLDQILSEQNLGSSDLADPSILARLGRLRFSRLLLAGSVNQEEQSLHASFRVFDTETSEIMAADVIGGASTETEVAEVLARESLSSLLKDYPVRARIAAVNEAELYLNVGTDVGLEIGQEFRVLKNPEKAGPRGIDLMREAARGTVTEAAPGACIGQIRSGTATLTEEMGVEFFEKEVGFVD